MNWKQWLGRMAMGPMKRALPAMGDTERAALEAGTVGFEGRILAGEPRIDGRDTRTVRPIAIRSSVLPQHGALADAAQAPLATLGQSFSRFSSRI